MKTITFLILIFCWLLIASHVNAEELSKELSVNEDKSQTKIMISTSGPTEFKSYSLENPYRIVIEFQSQNVTSGMDREIVVANGLIKKITSGYFEKGNRKAVKMLTFELSKQSSYKISQENDAIVLSIQAPLEIPAFNVNSNGIFEVTENSNNIRRLETMDAVLKQAKEIKSPFIVPIAETSQPGAISKPQRQRIQISMQQGVFWFLGLILTLGFLAWTWYKYNINKSKSLLEEIKGLQAAMQKKDAVLWREETLREVVEKASLEKEKQYNKLQIRLQEKEKVLLETGEECRQFKDSYESLKDILVKKGVAKELSSSKDKGGLWINGKSPEQRISPRLPLDKDFHNTVIIKIEPLGASQKIKSFAENISSGGLCFKTKSELDEKNPLNLRLFFYGGRVPNIKTHVQIAWKKTIGSKSYYGASFKDLSEKIKSELESYIESSLTEAAGGEPYV